MAAFHYPISAAARPPYSTVTRVTRSLPRKEILPAAGKSHAAAGENGFHRVRNVWFAWQPRNFCQLHDLRGGRTNQTRTSPKTGFACGSMLLVFSFAQNICTTCKCFVQKHGVFHPAGGEISFLVRDRVTPVSYTRYAVCIQIRHVLPQRQSSPAAAWYFFIFFPNIWPSEPNVREKAWSLPPCRRRYPPSHAGSSDTCQHWQVRGFCSFRVGRGPNAHRVTRVS